MKLIIFLIFLSSLTFAQVRRVKGSVTDTAFPGKFYAPTLCICDSSIFRPGNKSLTDCEQTDDKGYFDREVPQRIKNYPYYLVFTTIARDLKIIPIYDTTKFPLHVILEDPFIREKLNKSTHARKHDTTVKLVKFEHKESIGHNSKLPADKTFTRKYKAKTHQITIRYNASCCLGFEPIVKFSSDTLFIQSNDNPIDVACWSLCTYVDKIHVSGLKKKKYIVLLDNQKLTERE